MTLSASYRPPPPPTSIDATSRSKRTAVLSDPGLFAAISRYVGSRAPRDEVEDVVQSTFTDALAAREAPVDAHEIRLWVYAIARNKVADLFRRTRREVPQEPSLADEEAAAADSAPASARELLRWAEKELPVGEGAESTLEWMLREGQGEKLESIAAEANVPAPRVRQRVARLRRHFRARWAAQVAAVAAVATLLVIAIALVAFFRRRETDAKIVSPSPAGAPVPPTPQELGPEQRGKEIRRVALQECERQEWRPCLDGLDSAKQLDPAGDPDVVVQRARSAAAKALDPAPSPVPAPPPASASQLSAEPVGTGTARSSLTPPAPWERR